MRAPPPAARRAPLSLLWQREELRARLEAAARRDESLAFDVFGETRFIEVARVTQRGKTWMVLGEDLVTGESIAMKLDDVAAIAALPDNFDPGRDGGIAHDLDDDEPADDELDDDELDGGAAAPAPARWQPGPGQAAPPGHVPCPCGSGKRYRQCCRDVARA